MKTKTIEYQCDEVKLKGHLVFDQSVPGKRPAVIVAHAWRGQDEFAREKAEHLAELGYVGFAVDLYGDGISVTDNEKALNLMLPLFLDRHLLQDRMIAAVDVLKNHPLVESDSIGAIGFCFGGLAVIELLRSGTDIAGAVSFHGVLGSSIGEHHANLVPIAKGIKGSLLIQHGHEDPLVSVDDLRNIQEEMTKAKVIWEMDIYSNTMHAFTNPEANEPDKGLAFNERSARRSWESMCDFFDEILL